MDAEQRSVFQGIVYYYRENMVNCRYQVTLKDAVDGALLQQALDAARAKASYYFQKPVWEKKLLHLEPSDAPCLVRQGSAKPEFPDENGFTVALSYEGKVVYFDWFHFLADGRGIAPFMTMVLQFYCNLRYGTAFEGQTLETDPAYDIEDILAKYPESQVANDMQRPVVQTFEETPTCCRIRLEKAGLVDAALRCGVKPFSTLTALLCKAVRAYLDKDEVLYSYSTDARDALGAPNALYNCVASFQRKLPLTADAPLAEVAVGVDADLKKNLSAERKLFRIAEQMGWVYRVYQQKASLSIKKRIFQMGEYISGFPADFWVSYLGDPFAPSSPELTRYIEDFQIWCRRTALPSVWNAPACMASSPSASRTRCRAPALPRLCAPRSRPKASRCWKPQSWAQTIHKKKPLRHAVSVTERLLFIQNVIFTSNFHASYFCEKIA